MFACTSRLPYVLHEPGHKHIDALVHSTFFLITNGRFAHLASGYKEICMMSTSLRIVSVSWLYAAAATLRLH